MAARIKEELLKDFNLHTIVRLPNGVFAPYTGIPTNLLFFDRSGPTKEVWYYEMPLPEGRKNYTKTKPMQFEEFADCLSWWRDRQEGERAWRVPAEEIAKNGYNLDIKNPNGKKDLEQLPPGELVESILSKEKRIAEIMGEIKLLLAEEKMKSKWPMVSIGEVLTQYKKYIGSPELKLYPKLSVKLYGKGVILDSRPMELH